MLFAAVAGFVWVIGGHHLCMAMQVFIFAGLRGWDQEASWVQGLNLGDLKTTALAPDNELNHKYSQLSSIQWINPPTYSLYTVCFLNLCPFETFVPAARSPAQ